MRISSLFLLALLVLVLVALAACRPQPERILLVADGQPRYITIARAATVAEALREAGIALDPLDRVEPPSYTPLSPDLRVVVTRVRERPLTVERPLPYAREVRRDATLPHGETRLHQLGQNGTERLTYTVRYEDGQEADRTLAATEVLTPAVAEVLIVGTRGGGASVPVSGTIAYLADGNGWLIRQESGLKRALTRTGDLDGHVFSLSPDGIWLLFSRRPLGGEAGLGGPLNALWVMRTDIVNDEPRYLGLDSVLWAAWQPGVAGRRFAYSTGVRVPTTPGWRANNDLFLATLDAEGQTITERQQLHPEERTMPYAWWGRAWRWAPDGRRLAWADAVSLGTTTTGRRTVRQATFTPYETRGPWVWTPTPDWYPTGASFVAVVHGPPAAGEQAEYAERFDLWRFPAEGGAGEMMEANVGMWALPTWSAQGRLAYGRAEDPATSMSSRYRIVVTDQDGRRPRPLFPAPEQPGVDVPWLAWSPRGDQLLAVWQGDLYLIDLDSESARPLTIEGGVSRPQWR